MTDSVPTIVATVVYDICKLMGKRDDSEETKSLIDYFQPLDRTISFTLQTHKWKSLNPASFSKIIDNISILNTNEFYKIRDNIHKDNEHTCKMFINVINEYTIKINSLFGCVKMSENKLKSDNMRTISNTNIKLQPYKVDNKSDYVKIITASLTVFTVVFVVYTTIPKFG